MVVVIDTNIIMNAAFDQLNHEDCWHIIGMIRKKLITPLMCQGLKIEYFFIPSRIALNSLQGKFKTGELKEKEFKESDQAIYDCIEQSIK